MVNERTRFGTDIGASISLPISSGSRFLSAPMPSAPHRPEAVQYQSYSGALTKLKRHEVRTETSAPRGGLGAVVLARYKRRESAGSRSHGHNLHHFHGGAGHGEMRAVGKDGGGCVVRVGVLDLV